jgi:glycosyltransferase involved in cell wall biosynthesis
MPRVLLVHEPPDGGVAVNAFQLAMGLRAHGWDVEIAGPRASRIYDDAHASGVPVHRLSFARGYRQLQPDAAAFGRLVSLLADGGYDLVHCHSTKAGILGRLAAASRRLPAVYSPHCFAFSMARSAALLKTAVLVERMLAPLTAATICVCEAERAAAVRRRIGPAERLHVVRNACAECDDAVEPDAELAALASSGPLAAAVTVLRRQKGIDVLLRAVPLVIARIPEARFAVIGEGPLAEQLREQAGTLGLAERVRFLPFTAPTARYLRAIDVFVLPSRWEGLSIGLLEALACGVPQVATDVGGTAEAVTEETGLLVAADDVAGLADALCALLGDPARRARLSEASRRRHAECFTLERMVEETARVYYAALGRPLRRSYGRSTAPASGALPQ